LKAQCRVRHQLLKAAFLLPLPCTNHYLSKYRVMAAMIVPLLTPRGHNCDARDDRLVRVDEDATALLVFTDILHLCPHVTLALSHQSSPILTSRSYDRIRPRAVVVVNLLSVRYTESWYLGGYSAYHGTWTRTTSSGRRSRAAYTRHQVKLIHVLVSCICTSGSKPAVLLMI
jgi:hypothetical protein